MGNQRRILPQSPIGLEENAIQQITALLNSDMATLFLLFQQLKKHHWIVSGGDHYSLHKMLDSWAERALQDADDVAERIVTVGGIPLDTPGAMESAAAFAFEASGTPSVREMFESDLAAEQALIRKLREHIRLLGEIGDYGSADLLTEILVKHEDQAKDMALYLAEEGLTYGLLQQKQKAQKKSS